MADLLRNGRFGPRDQALAQMENVVTAPENVVIDKTTRERTVYRFFRPDGTLLTGEGILSLDEEDGGSRRRNFDS
jgi:hypothetical protein